jgi:AcrR family transcriptional regulator
VEVAAQAFNRDGAQATLKEIAKQAGVGIGTLYRHFPTRQELVEAVYRSETERLCDSAPELLRELSPIEALRTWTSQFLEYMATKGGMADVLHGILTADEGLRTDTRIRLNEALALLIDAGKRSGELREDLEIGEVSLALGGFALILDQKRNAQELGQRLIALLLDGLARN